MSEIITNVRIIYPENWMLERDGKWYTHIPFECGENDDVIMEFTDTDEYIQEHKADFDALNNGFTTKNECTITADHKPSCPMQITIHKAVELKGEIIYKKNAMTGEFEPEWRPEQSNAGLFGMLGGLGGGMITPEIQEQLEKTIEDKTEKTESGIIL